MQELEVLILIFHFICSTLLWLLLELSLSSSNCVSTSVISFLSVILSASSVSSGCEFIFFSLLCLLSLFCPPSAFSSGLSLVCWRTGIWTSPLIMTSDAAVRRGDWRIFANTVFTCTPNFLVLGRPAPHTASLHLVDASCHQISTNLFSPDKYSA